MFIPFFLQYITYEGLGAFYQLLGLWDSLRLDKLLNWRIWDAVWSYTFLVPEIGIPIICVSLFGYDSFPNCAVTWFVLGIHGKKSPCFECHVEVHGTGIKTFVLHLVVPLYKRHDLWDIKKSKRRILDNQIFFLTWLSRCCYWIEEWFSLLWLIPRTPLNLEKIGLNSPKIFWLYSITQNERTAYALVEFRKLEEKKKLKAKVHLVPFDIS